VLSGSTTISIDDRSRLQVPTRYIAAMRELAGAGDQEEIPVVITFTPRRTIGIYPLAVYRKMIATLKKLHEEKKRPEFRKLLLAYVNFEEPQSMDKQQRLRIPQLHSTMVKLTGIGNQAVIVGSESYLELMSLSRFEEISQEVLPLMEQWSDLVLQEGVAEVTDFAGLDPAENVEQ